ncbi:NusA-like transcription termination signal-binding factor [Candidatus Woesearchaeota archaeon]|nr:NusA-like transcription termination signal-binding factor [Candidatus Woesearchaeota archaeon]
MKSRIYDTSLIQYITLFESVTKTNLKDCLSEGETLIFIVEPEQMGKAIGKNGKTVQRLQHLTKKRIKIVEFSEDVINFIKNLITPLQIDDVSLKDETAIVTTSNAQIKNALIGRNSSKIKQYEKIVQRFFQVKNIQVKYTHGK